MAHVLDKEYVTVSTAAKELGLSRQRVHRLICSGQLDAQSVHERLLLIPRAALNAFKKVDRPNGLHIGQRQEHKIRSGQKKTG